MRKRIFDSNVKKHNIVINPIDSPSVVVAALTVTAGTVTTLDSTTGGIDTVNASRALNISGTALSINLTAQTVLKFPSSPYKTSGMEYGAMYFSGVYVYAARSGAWISGLLTV